MSRFHKPCRALQEVELAERHVSLRDPAAGELVMVPSNDSFDLEHVSQRADVHKPVQLEPAGQPRRRGRQTRAQPAQVLAR